MNEDIKYNIQKVFGSYSINVADDYVSKTYYDVQDDIIRIIKQLEKQNTELKDNCNELKEDISHILEMIEHNKDVIKVTSDEELAIYSLQNKIQEIEGGMNE